MPSKSSRFSRSSCRKWVTNTDSAILSGGNKTSVFSVAKSAGGELRSPMVRQLPWEDVKRRKSCHSCFPRPLCGLNGTV